MKQSLHQNIKELKAALLKLAATGENGFEGLLATTLTEITGIPFRLAGSGQQFGVDAMPAYEGDSVSFEGKRYDSRIPRTEVLSKIAELSIGNDGNIDLWVLGATRKVTSQLADTARKLGKDRGISVFIMDWSSTGLPPLAVALAMSGAAAAQFLEEHVKDNALASKAVAALEAIRDSNKFAQHASRIRSSLAEPALGFGIARQANIKWLTEVFSNKQQARRFLGQPLSPGDLSEGRPLSRDALINRLTPFLTGQPDDKFVAVLGGEGNGKSWLVGQCWLSVEEKPVVIVLTPEDFVGASRATDVEGVLIRKLVAQTGNHWSTEVENRWRRKLARWRSQDAPYAPRVVVLIDGLNQRPETDWARLIDAMSSELSRIGSRLIVTVRTPYFRSHIKRRLISPAAEIEVPEWSDAERDEILASHGVRGADLRATVSTSLRNPRILGIALDLLQDTQIKDLDELSVSRLLFEHMRANERDAPVPQPAYEFTRRLQDHANEVLSRVTAQQDDDLNVFDGGLEAVADGRFFVPVEGDPTHYALNEKGLTLALGFSVLDGLRFALRNGHDLEATLDAIIEPIGALDRTADVIMAALTVACLDEDCAVEIGAAIVGAFAGLQNPNTDGFGAFSGLARTRPEVFMQAAYRLCLAGGHQPNFDWIDAALHSAKDDAQAWSVMANEVQHWLAHYSLSPEAGMISHRSRAPADEVEKERSKNQNEIDERLRSLSPAEQALLNNLVRNDDGDLNALTRLALTLIAGNPVAPFAASLVQRSFASALNPSYAAPHKELAHLVRLNCVDWPETRQAILRECGAFEGSNVSRSGKWALVSMLRATGHPEESARAETLVAELTADRPRREGWRLVEKYCASDPCDPNSKKPTNISGTANDYAANDVTKIRLSMSSSVEDHFFTMACPGVARFVPKTAIEEHRKFIADVLCRKDLPLRQGLLELRRDNALVTREDALQLVQQIDAGVADDEDGALREQDRWIVAEYRQLVAFPHLGGKEQIEILLGPAAGEEILLELMDVAKPLDTETFEAVLDDACRDNDENAQFRVLAFGRCTQTVVSEKARGHLIGLASSESERVREQAIGLISQISDDDLLNDLVQSGWSAANVEREDGREAWFGSVAILESAARGLIPHDEALDRIAPEHFGRAAKRLNANARCEIARRIDASIKSAANLAIDCAVPDIELPIKRSDRDEPALYSASEQRSESDDPLAALKRFTESAEAFEERQRRLRHAFVAFREKLTEAKARIILDNLGIDAFDLIAASNKSLADSWYELFVNLSNPRLAAVHNLGHLLAHALAARSPDKAAHLFTVLRDIKPFVRVSFGHAGVTLNTMTVWSAVDGPVLNELRFNRLVKVGNDHELALEVLAALWANKEPLLREYVEQRLKTDEPAMIARALMVAGFSEYNKFNDELLARYQGTAGFIGRSHAAATYAYERNIWAEHWFRKMYETESPEDFWRYSVLFTKIVDGRFDVWKMPDSKPGEPFNLFWPSVESSISHRSKRWKGYREKKLFGDDAPSEAFLHH